MAKRRVQLYNQLLELMKKKEYYGDRLSPDNAIKDSAYGKNTEDIGFEDLLNEGTLADSTGKRIPSVKGRGTNGRIDKIGRMLDRGNMLFMYLPNEDMPRALYVENGRLKMSEDTIDNMSASDVPPSYRSNLSTALRQIQDPKRIERRHRNDAGINARVSNSSAEEAFDSLVSKMRSTMHYDNELNSMGVRNGMDALLKGGVILNAEGRRIHSTEHANRKELIAAIGKRLYDKQEPLYIYRPDEAYPREVYMSRDGSIHISEKPIDQMTEVIPKVWASPFARIGWKNERVFARDRYEIREKLKTQLAERAKKRQDGLDRINIDAAKKVFDTKLDAVEDMLVKASEEKENAKTYDNGLLNSYGKGNVIEFDPTSNTYVHYDTTNMSPMERAYARYVISNGLIGKTSLAERDKFYKENYDKTDEAIADENRQKNDNALSGYNSTFTDHPENVKDEVKEEAKPELPKAAETEKKSEPVVQEPKKEIPVQAAPADDLQKTMLSMMAQMMATNNLLLKKAFGDSIPEEAKATLENQQKMLDALNRQIAPNAVEKKEEPIVEAKNEPVVEAKNEPVVEAEKKSVFRPRGEKAANKLDVQSIIKNPDSAFEFNAATEKFVYFSKKDMSPAEEYKIRHLIRNNITESNQEHKDLIDSIEASLMENSPESQEKFKKLNEESQKESVDYFNSLDDNWIDAEVNEYVQPEWDVQLKDPISENDRIMSDPKFAVEYNQITGQFEYFDKSQMEPLDVLKMRSLIQNNANADSPDYQETVKTFAELEKKDPEKFRKTVDEMNEQFQNEARAQNKKLIEEKKQPVFAMNSRELGQKKEILSDNKNINNFSKKLDDMRKKLNEKLAAKQNVVPEQTKEISEKELDNMTKKLNEKNEAKQNVVPEQTKEISEKELDNMTKKLNEKNEAKQNVVPEQPKKVAEEKLDKANEPSNAKAEENAAVKKNSAKPGAMEEVELLIYRMEQVTKKPMSEDAKSNIYSLYSDAKRARENIETRSQISKDHPNDPKFTSFDASKDVKSIVRFECLKKVLNDKSEIGAAYKKGLVSMFSSRNYLQHIDGHFTGNKLNYICRGKQTLDFYDQTILNKDSLDLICAECCKKATTAVKNVESIFGKDSFAKGIHAIDKKQFLAQHKQPAVNVKKEEAAINI